MQWNVISMNGIFLESQVFGLTAKGDVQLFNCIVSVEQHKCTVAQVHSLSKK